MTIKFTATDFATGHEAIQYADAAGGKAVRLHGRNYVMREAEAERLAAAGVEFAYLVDHQMLDGTFRIMTVPIN